eukprot:15932926-Heterocapsa_arctica.AAC.1
MAERACNLHCNLISTIGSLIFNNLAQNEDNKRSWSGKVKDLLSLLSGMHENFSFLPILPLLLLLSA